MRGFLERARTQVGVKVRPAFWLMAGLYGWYAGGSDPARILIWVAVIAASLLAHEYGHALAILAFGSGADIELQGFGGVTVPRLRQDLATWKRCVISASGCAMGLLVAFAAFQVDRSRPGVLVGAMWRVNLVWSVFNLLPMQPLDGGHLLEIVLGGAFGPWGRKAALGLSVLAAAAITFYFWRAGSQFNAMLTALFALGGYSRMRDALRRVPQDDDPALQEEHRAALELMRRGDLDAAIRALVRLRRKAGAGELHAHSTELLGMCFHARGRDAAAYAMFGGLGGRLSAAARPILQLVAYRMGRYEESAAAGRQVFLGSNDPEAAFLLAQASVRLGDELGAMRWLKAAYRHGLAGGASRLRGEEFAVLRGDAGFQELERSPLSR